MNILTWLSNIASCLTNVGWSAWLGVTALLLRLIEKGLKQKQVVGFLFVLGFVFFSVSTAGVENTAS